MKYIKKFENNNLVYIPNKYWLIPTDDRFSLALEQLKLSKYFLDNFLNNPHIPRNEYIFICNYNWCQADQWSWDRFNGVEYDKCFDDKGNKYAGKILISDHELEAKKFNL
jgi:hypothetical protein